MRLAAIVALLLAGCAGPSFVSLRSVDEVPLWERTLSIARPYRLSAADPQVGVPTALALTFESDLPQDDVVLFRAPGVGRVDVHLSGGEWAVEWTAGEGSYAVRLVPGDHAFEVHGTGGVPAARSLSFGSFWAPSNVLLLGADGEVFGAELIADRRRVRDLEGNLVEVPAEERDERAHLLYCWKPIASGR